LQKSFKRFFLSEGVPLIIEADTLTQHSIFLFVNAREETELRWAKGPKGKIFRWLTAKSKSLKSNSRCDTCDEKFGKIIFSEFETSQKTRRHNKEKTDIFLFIVTSPFSLKYR
jgi:hypothetical protein